MNPNACYRLSKNASIRPERFGGLLYRHDNRRLYFLYSRDLVDFVSRLDEKRALAEQLRAFQVAQELPDSSREALLRALTQLEKMEVLHEL